MLLTLAAGSVDAQNVIRLKDAGDGKYMMDASVAGVGVKTYYTDEEWYASMSTTTYLFLYENGYISPSDVNGMTTVKMPGGSSTKAGSFVIRNLKVGNTIVKDLPAFVIAKQEVPLLVGKAAFDCFGEVTRNGTTLIIDDRFEDEIAAAQDAGTPAVEEPAPEDNIAELTKASQAYLEAKDYANAATCFDTLYEKGVLTMYSEYQYAMVLGILKRNDDAIDLCNKWLETNTGHSLVLDFWMYDTLADSYARKGKRSEAIANYHNAIDTYCTMFNTTEKEIRKSVFKDETLGVTLYNLAMQYSSTDIGKTEYYASLAAKSGNASAIAYCDKCHLKY